MGVEKIPLGSSLRGMVIRTVHLLAGCWTADGLTTLREVLDSD